MMSEDVNQGVQYVSQLLSIISCGVWQSWDADFLY